MRSQNLLETIKNIVRRRQENAATAEQEPFATPDMVKAADAPHGAEAYFGLADVLPDKSQDGSLTRPPSTPGTMVEPQAKRAREEPIWAEGEKPELTKPTKGSDLEPWSDGFYGLLQAADYPAVDPQDGLIHGGEEDLPPEA